MIRSRLESKKITMIKKLVVAQTVLALGIMGAFSSIPASAQTVVGTTNVGAAVNVDARVDAKVRGALDTLRAARVRLDKSPNDVSAQRDHLRDIVSVLRERIAVHKRLRAADKDLLRTLNDEDAALVKLDTRVKGATAAELKTIAKELKDRRDHDVVTKGILRSYFAQLSAGVKLAESRSERVADVLQTLAREGKNVSALQDKLAEADRDISQAATIVAGLETRIAPVNGTIDLTAIKQSMKDAAKNLMEAFRMFGEIIDSAKAL